MSSRLFQEIRKKQEFIEKIAKIKEKDIVFIGGKAAGA
jgi:hypothetical protein